MKVHILKNTKTINQLFDMTCEAYQKNKTDMLWYTNDSADLFVHEPTNQCVLFESKNTLDDNFWYTKISILDFDEFKLYDETLGFRYKDSFCKVVE